MQPAPATLFRSGLKSRLQSVVSRELRALRVERALNSTIQSATEYKKHLKDHMAASASSYALVQEGIVTDVNDAWLQQFKIAASKDELDRLPIDGQLRTGQSARHSKARWSRPSPANGRKGEKLIVKAHIDSGDAEELHLEFRRIDLDDGPSVQIALRRN